MLMVSALSVSKIDVVIFIQSMNRLGGTEIVALNLKQGLCDAGISTIILTLEEYDGDEAGIVSISEKDRTKYDIKQCPLVNKLFPKRYNDSIKRCLKDFCLRYHVKALLNYTYENLVVLPTEGDFRTIGVYHWSVEGYEESLYNLIFCKPLVKRLLSAPLARHKYNQLHRLIGQTDYAVALTQSGKEELEKIAPSARVKVIPNFLPYNEASPKVSQGDNRRAVFVGRLSREKGVYHLLDIWEKVAQRLPDVELEIYGEGDERRAMINEISNRKIPRIYFKGFEKNPESIYLTADLLLCTSETEGFGMVLIEAMYFGVVPIAFDCPVSPKELIADAGVTIKCFDTDHYSDAVVRLFDSSTLLAEYRSRGLKRSPFFYKKEVISKWRGLID